MDNHWYAMKYDKGLVTVFRFETHRERDLFVSQQVDIRNEVYCLKPTDDLIELAKTRVELRKLDWADGVIVCRENTLK